MFRSFAVVICATLLAISTAQAQTNFTRPIKMYFGFGPGGITWVHAQFFSQLLTEELNHPVVIETMIGGGGTVPAIRAAARDNDHNHTLIHGATGTFVTGKIVDPSLPYDTIRDFEMVAINVLLPFCFVVSNKFEVSSYKDFRNIILSNPNKYNFAANEPSSALTQLTTLQASLEKFNIAVIPYRSSAQMSDAIMASQVDAAWLQIADCERVVSSGRGKVLLINSNRIRPEGLSGYETTNQYRLDQINYLRNWTGFAVSKQMHPELQAKIKAAVQRVHEKLVSNPDRYPGSRSLLKEGYFGAAATKFVMDDIATQQAQARRQ